MLSKKPDKIETMIGANSLLRGEIEVKGTLRIDGRIEGNCKADWVVAGEKGCIKGDIQANGVIVGGTVEGNITGRESVEIKSHGRVCGDIRTQKLIIIEGGVFDGNSTMKKDEGKVLELQHQKTSEPRE
jgi:cytoskeletal protein CcmA (bactofilin family)